MMNGQAFSEDLEAKHKMPKVIEWIGARENDIVWKICPNEEIAWDTAGAEDIAYRFPNLNLKIGSQVIVHENEAAVFFRDGKAYDVFRAGRHALTTANLPLLTKHCLEDSGFDKNPFTSNRRVYFAETSSKENSASAHRDKRKSLLQLKSSSEASGSELRSQTSSSTKW